MKIYLAICPISRYVENMKLVNNCELYVVFGSQQQVMQETSELKEKLEKERVELESRLRQQIDQQQQRASDLDNQVHKKTPYK